MSKKIGLILLSLTLILLAATINFELPEREITLSSESGITIFSGDVGGDAGSPALPFYRVKLLLPPTADIQSVRCELIDATVSELAGTFNIAPAKAPMLMGEELLPPGVTLIDGKNPVVFNNNHFIPATVLSNVNSGNYRSYKTVTCLISPFQYNPVSKKLRKIEGGTLQVTYSESRNSAVTEPNFAQDKVLSSCINANEQLGSYPTPNRANTTYLIVTTDNIKNQLLKLDSFIEVKKGKGFNVETITESDYGSGPDNLRSWLQENYQSKNIEYVLIIGTPDPQGGDIPMKVMYPMKLSEIGKEEYRDVPSDQYFSELTGNWDLNGNGIYGEGDDCGSGGALSDPEVKVGRLPYNSAQTIDEVLQKSIDYETADENSIAWRKNMFQSVVKYDDETSGDPMMDGIKALATGWNTKKLSQGQCSETAVTNEWNSGTYGYKVWLTHGLWNMAQHIINSNYAKTLKKDNPCFVVMGSCLNARPRDGNLSATVLTTAGIGCLAATQVSLYRPGEIYKENQWYNQALLYHFSRLLIEEEQTIGEIVSTMMSDLSIDYPGAGYNWWHNWPNFTIYGDPSLAITSCGAVEAETIEITKPAEGDKWQQGSEQTITWETTCSSEEELRIILLKEKSETVIGTSTAGKTSFKWTVPASAAAGIGYTIRIEKSSDSEVFGISNSFRITEADNTEYTLIVEGGSGGGTYKAGTVIAIEADEPEEGTMFDTWSGSGSNAVAKLTSAKTELTMPARDVTIEATYKKIPPSSGNLVLVNPWESESCDLSESSFDSSQISSDTIVTMAMTVGIAPDDNTYPWCKVSAHLDGKFDNVSAIRLLYKSNCEHLIELIQEELSDSGANYAAKLPQAASWEELIIPVNEEHFSQPTWLDPNSSVKKPLTLSELSGISFVSNNGQGKKAEIQFKDVTILGYEKITPLMSLMQRTTQSMAVTLTSEKLQLSIPADGHYKVSLFSLSGRTVYAKELQLQKGFHTLPMKNKSLSGQILITKIVDSQGKSNYGKSLLH